MSDAEEGQPLEEEQKEEVRFHTMCELVFCDCFVNFKLVRCFSSPHQL